MTVTNQLRVGGSYSTLFNRVEDISATWPSIIASPSLAGNDSVTLCSSIPSCAETLNDLKYAIANGDYVISETQYSGLDTSYQVHINFSREHNMYFDWEHVANTVQICSPTNQSINIIMDYSNSTLPSIRNYTNDPYELSPTSPGGCNFVSLNSAYPDGNFIHKLFASSISNYPFDYDGVLAPSLGIIDNDQDGLTAEKEFSQGTSDEYKDFDGDGLEDFIESQWNPDRDDIFCGTECAYPNPTKKDIYVEVDWMNDTSNSRLLKPTTAQLEIIAGMYENQDINFHADTGQYGGGNVLSTYAHALKLTADPLVLDFGDYKNTNFSTDRENIWRYLVYGYEYTESPGSSGRAEVSGDDIFVSGGIVEDNSGVVNLDRAIAGTLSHEIGHTLCLSNSLTYAGQPASCIYANIDNPTNKPVNYRSVMNYRYQLTDDDDMGVVDYSDGSHGTSDHDDWGAVLAGMSKFNQLQSAPGAKLAQENKAMDPARLSDPGPQPYTYYENKQGQNEIIDEHLSDKHTPLRGSQEKISSNENVTGNNQSERDVINDKDQIILIAVGAAIVIGVAATIYVKLSKNKSQRK